MPQKFERQVKTALVKIDQGIRELDRLSQFKMDASPTDAQFDQIKAMRDRLGQHCWGD